MTSGRVVSVAKSHTAGVGVPEHNGSGAVSTELSMDLAGLRVEMDREGEPVLLRPDGTVVDTWREGYPYGERMTRRQYDLEKRLLQIELLKLQNWI